MELGIGLTEIIPPVIYTIAILVVLATLFYKIEIGIFFLIPLLPQQSLLDRIMVYPMGKDFIDILVLAILIRWLFNGKKDEEGRFVKTKFNLPIFLIILWTYFGLWRGSFYLGTGPPISLRDPRFIIWKNFMIMPILYLAVLNNVKNPKHIRYLVMLMALSIFAMGGHFRNNFRHMDTSHYRHDMRMEGTFTYLSPNAIGVFFAQYSMFILALFMSEKSKLLKLFYGSTVGLCLYSVMFSFSRGGYLAVLLGLIFTGWYRDKRILVVLGFFLLTWKVFVPTAVIERIEMSEGDRSIEERLDLWETGKQVISNNPIIGVGFATFSIKRIEEEVSGQSRESFHNGFIQVSAEMGLIGLFVFIYIYTLGLKAGLKLYRTAEDPFTKAMGFGLAACIVSALAGNLGGSYWHFMNVSGFYWVLQALVVRSLLNLEKQSGVPEPEPKDKKINIPERRKLRPVTNL